MQLKILALGIVGMVSLAACGAASTDSTTTPPETTPVTPPATTPVTPPATTPVVKGLRVLISPKNCYASFSVASSDMDPDVGTTLAYDKTFTPPKGTVFVVSAQSTCGADGSVSINLYSDGKLVASDSAVGPDSASASAQY